MSSPPKKKSRRQQTKKKKVSLPLLGVIFLVILNILVLLYIYLQNSQQTSVTEGELAVTEQEEVLPSTADDHSPQPPDTPQITQAESTLIPPQAVIEEIAQQQSTQDDAPAPAQDQGEEPLDAEESLETLDTVNTSDWGKSILSCSEKTKTVRQFYTHLEEQPYLEQFDLDRSLELHFTSLIDNLIKHPPTVSRETDDLFTILKNTAHFFRVIGKDNILMLKAILDGEKGQFEAVLADFYSMTEIPDCTDKSFSLTIPEDALYDYAGFFLNTMGGRLYLFRRDSMSRMTVNYYAILIVDKANDAGNNKYNIQLIQPIDALIAELESNSAELQMKEMYLDKLYDLKEKYQ